MGSHTVVSSSDNRFWPHSQLKRFLRQGSAKILGPPMIPPKRNSIREITPHKPGVLYNVVALDLDGTLLTKKHEVTKETVAYLHYLHAKGVTIIIATGRAAPSVYATVIRLNLPEPIPVVCSNGSYGILCMPDPALDCGVRIVKELFSYPVPLTVTKKALRLSDKLGCVLQYYLGNNIYANPSQDKHYKLTELYSSLTGVETIYVDDNYQSMLQEVEEERDDGDNHHSSCSRLPSKLLVLSPKDEMLDVWKDFVEAFPRDEATLVYGSQGWFLEILYPQVCKGFGLEQMCRELDVDIDLVIAFGDADNDIEFLQVAGRGIAMKNARNVTKSVADEVAKHTNNEDGVRRTLKRMEKEGLLYFEYYS